MQECRGGDMVPKSEMLRALGVVMIEVGPKTDFGGFFA